MIGHTICRNYVRYTSKWINTAKEIANLHDKKMCLDKSKKNTTTKQKIKTLKTLAEPKIEPGPISSQSDA